MNGLKKTLSIMLCVAMIASGSFMAFAEGESNPQNVTVVEGENAGENVGGEEGGNEGNEGENVDENKEENKDEDKQQSEQLKAAIGALNSLPLFDSLTEDTDADALLAQVQAARAAYDALTEEEKLLVEEAKLNNLLDLEFFFENRPSNTPADAPVDQVVATQNETETAEAGTQKNPTVVNNADELKAAVEAGGYIKLNDNITGVNEILKIETGKSVTIDLNNHNIGFSSQKNISLVGGNLELTGTGEIKEENPWFGPVIVKPFDGEGTASLTVGQGVTLTGWSSVFVEANQQNKNHSTNITIHGTLKSVADSSGDKGSGVYVNGTQTNIDQCPTITLSSTSNIISEGNGIYAAGYANWNLAGDMTGETGVEIRAGKMDITGGTIVATGDSTTVGPNGNGSTTIGAGVAIAQHTTKLPIEVTISGGTIKGATALKQSNPQNNDDTSVAQVEISVTGGTFEATSANGKAVESENVKNFIKGGSFSSPVDKEHLDESLKAGLYSPSANPDAPYSYYTSVEEAKAAAKDDPNAIVTDVETGKEEALYPAAKIGDKTYNTLEEALKAAKSDDTIVLQKDVSTGAITLPAGVTLDGGNHVITCNTEIATGAFITAAGDNVTIKNATVNVDGKAKHGIQFYCVKGGKLENVNVMGGKYTAVIVNGAEVSINGGNLSTNGYAVVEYAMGKNVTTVPKLTMNNVTTPNTDKPLVYMDKATIDRIKDNTKELGQNATTEQVIEHLKKDNLTGNNIKDMQVGENGMIIVPAPSTPVAPPVVPEKPNSNSGNTGSSSTVQQMEEREKPDPADKKAMEEYNFWMQVKSKIRATAEGKTLRITVKEGIEYMPASVMQTLYECKVGITLYWDGVTIEIPVGKAQPKQALRVYWTKTKLMDLYNA